MTKQEIESVILSVLDRSLNLRYTTKRVRFPQLEASHEDALYILSLLTESPFRGSLEEIRNIRISAIREDRLSSLVEKIFHEIPSNAQELEVSSSCSLTVSGSLNPEDYDRSRPGSVSDMEGQAFFQVGEGVVSPTHTATTQLAATSTFTATGTREEN